MKGVYKVQLLRNGEVIEEFEQENLITKEGKLRFLSLAFDSNATQNTSYAVGLMGNNVTISEDDTYSSKVNASGYNPVTAVQTQYPTYNANITSTGVSGSVSFTFTGNATVYGLFLIGKNSASATDYNVLVSALKFTNGVSYVANDVLNITYEIRV